MKSLVGMTFGRLHVLKRSGLSASGHRLWICRCDCGKTKELSTGHLTRTRKPTRSCGCLHSDVVRIHGHVKNNGGKQLRTSTYRTWDGMVQRCTNNRCSKWDDYGGRGIKLCERWRQFKNFLADMGERPEGMSIDRIDVNGNYEPGNCRWATAEVQAYNKRKAA